MAGRPSAAAEKAAKWLAADGGRTASQAAAKFHLSLRQAQRLVQQLGRARPVGRPPVPRHAYGHDADSLLIGRAPTLGGVLMVEVQTT